jgi:hypothetical protein
MALFLLRFYPVLLPLLLYWVWLFIVRRRARKKGEPLPRFRDGPLFWLIISSLAVAILCFMALSLSIIGKDSNVVYTEPTYQIRTEKP